MEVGELCEIFAEEDIIIESDEQLDIRNNGHEVEFDLDLIDSIDEVKLYFDGICGLEQTGCYKLIRCACLVIAC